MLLLMMLNIPTLGEMRAENFLPVFDEQKLIEDMKLSSKGKDTWNIFHDIQSICYLSQFEEI